MAKTEDTNPPLLFLIAGEASGDNLGAKLMRALKRQTGGNIHFAGIGGPAMEAEGLQSLFPMNELSLIGFVEIIPHLPRLLRRIRQTVENIEAMHPSLVLTIDSPGFAKQVAKRVQHLHVPLVHYVAPSVWAYKPKRAEKMARLYDHLLTLLDFEPQYFEREGLNTTWVGHPIVEEHDLQQGDASHFLDSHSIPENTPLIGMFPGSRNGEIRRHLPIFRECFTRLKTVHSNLEIACFAPPNLRASILEQTQHWPVKLHMVQTEKPDEKRNALAACTAAISKSGTVTLELAMAELPMVVIYKVNPFSAWLLRRMVRVKYASLVNILLDKPVIPEFLQEDATPENILPALEKLLTRSEAREEQKLLMRQALSHIGYGITPLPSEKAASAIASLISITPSC